MRTEEDLTRDAPTFVLQTYSTSKNKPVTLKGKSTVKKFVVQSWNYIFDHRVSPLRHIPDVSTRHMILQILGWMWATSFAIALGSYTIFAASVIGHVALIAAAAITVTTYTVAEKRPELFSSPSGRGPGGEHE